MIAVGRGRIIGKEAGTDRLFHVYMDELFRATQVQCNLGESPRPNDPRPVDDYDGNIDDNDLKDIPVPPFNMKIDPEYFTDNAATLIVPPEGTRNYASHPGSLRLAVFNELLELDISDVMLVLERARTWYLKDTRSQLAITAPEDFAFSDQDLVDVFTEEAILDILESLRKAAGEMSDNWFIKYLFDGLDIGQMAKDWHGQIVAQGSGIVVFAVYAAVGMIIYLVGNSGAIASAPGGKLLVNPRKLLDYLAKPVGNPKAQPYIDDAVGKLMALISQLMVRARRGAVKRYGDRPDVNRPNEVPPEWTVENRMPTPNQPPSWMPVYVRTTYMQRRGAGKGAWKKFYSEKEESKKVWLAVNADGSLEAFSQGAFDSIFHTSQGKPNGNWENGSWAPFFKDSDKVKKLTSALNSDGRLEIFRIDNDNRVFHTTQVAPNSGSFGGWQELYSSSDKRISIAAETNLDGRLEVFAVREDNQIFADVTDESRHVVEKVGTNLYLRRQAARRMDGTKCRWNPRGLRHFFRQSHLAHLPINTGRKVE